MNTFRSRISILVLIAFLSFIVACEDSGTEPDVSEQPTLPPATSMQVDFSLFQSGQSLHKDAAVTKLHFTTAAVVVTLVNISVVAHLAVPTTVFAAALSQEPVLKNDGKFHWIYTVGNYSADLAGWIDNENLEAVWEMRISHGENLNNFLWFDGRSNLNATSGHWIFYDADAEAEKTPVIRIDWVNNSETDRQLTFTNLWEGHPEKDDVLKYTINGNDHSVEFYDASEGTNAIIYWDAETTAGYIHLPNYNNGQPGYWDENQNDLP